jgi:hypothetical protein
MYLSASTSIVGDGPDRNGSDWTARNGVWPSLSQGRITSIRSGARRWVDNHAGVVTVATTRSSRGSNVCLQHGALDKGLLNGVRWRADRLKGLGP